MRRILIFGGVPNPIGGVTNFIYRILANNLVVRLVDIYPASEKKIPSTFKGDAFFYKSFIHFYFNFLFFRKIVDGVDIIHFNFSRPISILFLFFVPKKGLSFYLMLHHGDLKTSMPKFLIRFFISKMDLIYVLSDKQEIFYKEIGVPSDRLVRTSSYLPLERESIKPVSDSVYAAVSESDNDIFVISGCCNKIYNHHWVIDAFLSCEQENDLFVFLYGKLDYEYLSELLKRANGSKNVKFFFDKCADDFNFVLSNCKYYIRANSIDSFGMAVADAICLGVKVLASDVCKRYKGSYLFTPTDYESFYSAYREFLKESPNLLISSASPELKKFSYN